MMGLAFMLAGERPEFADDEAVHGGNGIADEARDPFVNAIALVQHEQYDKADTGVEYTGDAEAQDLPGKLPIPAACWRARRVLWRPRVNLGRPVHICATLFALADRYCGAKCGNAPVYPCIIAALLGNYAQP